MGTLGTRLSHRRWMLRCRSISTVDLLPTSRSLLRRRTHRPVLNDDEGVQIASPELKVSEGGGTMDVDTDQSVRRDIDELTREGLDLGDELCRRGRHNKTLPPAPISRSRFRKPRSHDASRNGV